MLEGKPIRVLQRLYQQVREEGPLATARYAFDATSWELHKLDPRFRAHLREHREFDAVHQVETSIPVFLDELDIPAESRATSYWYEAAEPWLIREMIDFLPIDFSRTSLVDLGSGKGRVLFIAADYPFKEVIGVELSQPLHEQAERNIATFVSPQRMAGRIASYCEDAANFVFPRNDLVITLFNPFSAEVLSAVLEHLRVSFAAGENRIFLAYVNPKHGDVVDNSGIFAELKVHERYHIYRWIGPRAPSATLPHLVGGSPKDR